MSYVNAFEGKCELTLFLSEGLSVSLRDLLETRHLYQKVEIDPRPITENIGKRILGSDEIPFSKYVNELICQERFVPALGQIVGTDRRSVRGPLPTLILYNVKVFCMECGAKEAFTPVFYRDGSHDLANLAAGDSRFAQPPPDYQIFLLLYQCQRCKGEPVAFLVSRHGMRLTLEGRSPVEYVEVPSYIPKQEQHLYRDAIVASQTGKVLAAIFYLRTFIEQFGRRIAKISGRATGEEIMEAYSSTLPEKARGHMPSLKEWYERLSAPIHSAKEDSALFEEARTEIDRHFDFRRIFKIP